MGGLAPLYPIFAIILAAKEFGAGKAPEIVGACNLE